MLIDLITNNRKIFDFVKREHGGRDKNGKYFSLINIPAGFPDAFCKELDEFIKMENMGLEEYDYRVLRWDGKLIQASGKFY